MRAYPECNRDLPELRQAIGQLFESLPELESIELTHGGKRYRARLSMPWVAMDAKAEGRGWAFWTEYPLPEYYRRGGRPSTAWEVNPKIHRLNAKEEPTKPTKPENGGLNRFSSPSPSVREDVFSDDDDLVDL